jgi:murein DD-endopeptidase MepM/ murein hydrolase activator NlpD
MIRAFFMLFAILSVSVANASLGNPEKKETRDTTLAVVVYDANAKFIPDVESTVSDYSLMIDSLLRLDTVPIHLVNQLNIFRMLSEKDEKNLESVIDSIFETKNVPKPVLNAVNLYMSAMEDSRRAPSGFYAYVPEADKSFYPGGSFYDNWNTLVPNPSRNNLSDFDSTLQVLLVDTMQNCDFHSPFKGVVTSHFGWRYGRNHNGIDIDLEVWDPVHAAFPGVVRVARFYKGFGRVVVVRHYNGLETTYAHLHRFKVKPGDIVEAGDVVGLGGSSGHSTGSHLHFEVRFQGVPIRPSQLIDFKNHVLKSPMVKLKKDGAFLAVVPDEDEIYLVKTGDNLYKIAKTFGFSVDELCTLNNIQANAQLKTGQKLKVGT